MRYFLEVGYVGTAYSGFQVQQNANTVQAEVERALKTLFRKDIILTGSSRTDSGVHAIQNFFHFDFDFAINPEMLYNLNSLLPNDIVIRSLNQVANDAHCRFDAIFREYKYIITKTKNPFVNGTSWYYPFTVDLEILNEAASVLLTYSDFTSFSKRNTQVKSKQCTVFRSNWYYEDNLLIYGVAANRFLRGMVRGLVATMLLVGRKKISVADFKEILEAKDSSKASFASPGHGLFLMKVAYENIY